MARRPIDEGLFVDQMWCDKKCGDEKIVVVNIYRKDRLVRYYKWGPKIVKHLATTHTMTIRDLRKFYKQTDIYIT